MTQTDPQPQLTTRNGVVLGEQQRLDWLRLIRSENVGPSTFITLINRFGTASAALDALPDLAQRGKTKRPIRIQPENKVAAELMALRRMGGDVICRGEPDYPTSLRATEGAPPVISVLGSRETLTRPSVAFVGARNASLAGTKFTAQLAGDVARAGFVIVSGLARGIDAAAHRAGLEGGTIAVFAGGLDRVYPSENERLAHEIVAKGGTLVAEMPLGWQGRAQDFPRRNRIVAGLGLGLVVVEAARRSGSLISARLANEYGRTVFAVPGSPLDPRSEGTNHLIQQGATLITCADDVVAALNPSAIDAAQNGYSLLEGDGEDYQDRDEPNDNERERLLSALDYTPMDLDEILRFADLNPAKAQLIILELELAGRVERHARNQVSLV
ncbi:MAG: DNA-processing protein DprA [Pseudomonadota bacterium]